VCHQPFIFFFPFHHPLLLLPQLHV
jgi:hypothetical protein